MGDPIKQHSPAFRTVETHENVGSEDDRKSLSAITQSVDDFIDKTAQDLNIPLT